MAETLKRALSVMGVLFLLLLTACQSPFARTGPKFDARASHVGTLTNLTAVQPAPPTNSVPSEPVAAPFTLGPGDKIEIEILGMPETRATTTVGPDGKIYFYLLPGLDIQGLTLAQARAALENALTAYMATPEVTVTLRAVESKRVWLLGRLNNSGIYPMATPMTLLECISLAGGLASPSDPGSTGAEDLADLRHSFVIRQGELLPVDFRRLIQEGDMSQNIPLHPDDFVYVPSAVGKEVYVLGAVRLAKPFAWTQSTTLISAVASAGGTIKDAYLSHVGIVRGSLTQPKIAVVDFKDIVAGRASDVHLEPGDIVYVPFTPYRTLVKYADLILATFARAVAINEGARAVGRDVSPVGVQIGIGLR